MFNDYFRVRDLKEWLEKLSLEDRKKCLCIIGGDDKATYLNLSTKDVDNICEFEVSDPDGSISHRGLLEKGYDRLNDYSVIEIEEENQNLEDEEDSAVNIVEVRTDIKEVVVLDNFGYKMTVEDLLKKLSGVDLDLPLMYDGVDLKTTCECGIGWWEATPRDEHGNEVTLDCGIWNWHSSHGVNSETELEKLVASEVPAEHTIEKAFVIELCDGGCLCDLSIWERPWN